MLKGFKILDFTHRLPGPLAGKILSDLGAQVKKIEDHIHKDPFLQGSFSEMDNSFEDWYKELNQNKDILRLDFKSSSIKEKIHSELINADGVLLSLSEKLKIQLGLDEDSLKKLGRPIAIIELKASKDDQQAMHDLNALAKSGFLSLHISGRNDAIIDPPFLPFAGISFGQQVASDCLAAILKSLKEAAPVFHTSYLFDSVVNNFRPFWSPTLRSQSLNKFLHNGAYPCYSLYRLKDGNYLAVAAVEEKFWSNLIERFQLDVPLEERFNTQPSVFKKVSDLFAKYDAKEIETMIKDKEFCLSIVRKV